MSDISELHGSYSKIGYQQRALLYSIVASSYKKKKTFNNL